MLQDMFILNLHQRITLSLVKQYSIRQEGREGFTNDNDTLCAELKYQLGNKTPGDPALPRQMPIDTNVSGLEGLEDSQNWSLEPETSLDLSQTFMDWELPFLDWDHGSNHGSLDNAEGAVASEMSNCLWLSLDDSQSGEAGPGAPRALEESSGHQDGANTMDA